MDGRGINERGFHYSMVNHGIRILELGMFDRNTKSILFHLYFESVWQNKKKLGLILDGIRHPNTTIIIKYNRSFHSPLLNDGGRW